MLIDSRLLSSFIAVCMVSYGCSDYDHSTICSEFVGRHLPASYTGGISGSGFVELADSVAFGEGAIRVYVVQNNLDTVPSSSSVLMQLDGTAECIDGRITGFFAASAGQNESFKVTGGRLVGELDPPDGFEPYGIWQIELVQLRDLELFMLEGAWRLQPD